MGVADGAGMKHIDWELFTVTLCGLVSVVGVILALAELLNP